MRITKKHIKFRIIGKNISIEKTPVELFLAFYLLGLITIYRTFFRSASLFDFSVWPLVLVSAIPSGIMLFYTFNWSVYIVKFFSSELAFLMEGGMKIFTFAEKKINRQRRIPKLFRLIVVAAIFLVMLALVLLPWAVLVGVFAGLPYAKWLWQGSLLRFVLVSISLSVLLFLFDRLGKKIGCRKKPD